MASANSVILYIAAPGKSGEQATLEVDGTLEEVQVKLMPGIWIDFMRGDERFMVNPALVTHARARRRAADLPEPADRESYMHR